LNNLQTLLVDFLDLELHPILDKKHEWLMSTSDVISGYGVDNDSFEITTNANAEHLHEDKHYLYRNFGSKVKKYWSKKGVVKLGFFIKSDQALAFIETIEELENPIIQDSQSSNENLVNIYKEIESYFLQSAAKMKENNSFDADEFAKMTTAFNSFMKTSANIFPQKVSSQVEPNSSTVVDDSSILNKTEDNAYSFASKTEGDAFDFASKTEGDAHEFASSRARDGFEFASKTEDDAYKFASKMEDDAYNFVTKMEEDAYQFASKGMDYGYMFTTQGEELGPMADRVLWMAAQIGTMADRIGEMADRIVHTEHLIVNTSSMILNFGMLVDNTVKHLSNSAVGAMSMVFEKDMPKELLAPDNDYLKIIAKNTNLIITQQHEYDMKVLDTQKELRDKTLSALDRIEYEY